MDHHKAVTWITPDHNELIYGRVYNRKGEDLTAKAAQRWNNQHSTSALTHAIESTSRPDSTGSDDHGGHAPEAGHSKTGQSG
ncbi:MAG TPA: hypothetical protein VKA64_06640 [Gammaproteobacteria bacterium]|nr:hypothetical protein [Gammaproteobacteria bacterium]